jgi:hypothetical protein
MLRERLERPEQSAKIAEERMAIFYREVRELFQILWLRKTREISITSYPNYSQQIQTPVSME